MLKFLRKSALWIIALPLLLNVLGAASNQLVLKANSDCFPVMWNDYKANEYRLDLAKKAQSSDPEVSLQAQFDIEALEQGGFIDNTHVIMTSHTHLNLLGDIIDFHTAIYSVGDLSIELGDYLWSYAPLTWGLVVVTKLKKEEDSEWQHPQ